MGYTKSFIELQSKKRKLNEAIARENEKSRIENLKKRLQANTSSEIKPLDVNLGEFDTKISIPTSQLDDPFVIHTEEKPKGLYEQIRTSKNPYPKPMPDEIPMPKAKYSTSESSSREKHVTDAAKYFEALEKEIIGIRNNAAFGATFGNVIAYEEKYDSELRVSDIDSDNYTVKKGVPTPKYCNVYEEECNPNEEAIIVIGELAEQYALEELNRTISNFSIETHAEEYSKCLEKHIKTISSFKRNKDA